jgi:hypothetical protein
LLQQQSQPTFVTINEKDFWRRVAINARFCVVCFALPDSRVHEIPSRLRSLFHHPAFKTKGERMGKVIRVGDEGISYYAFNEGYERLNSDPPDFLIPYFPDFLIKEWIEC